jgi:hypothetical protein
MCGESVVKRGELMVLKRTSKNTPLFQIYFLAGFSGEDAGPSTPRSALRSG